ncbi:MAG: hypothetical protein RO257_15645 [Candidatus Kapabacteria bacterium]|nr:hypothetical protein [Candidatus Kapabacteria bacterium]
MRNNLYIKILAGCLVLLAGWSQSYSQTIMLEDTLALLEINNSQYIDPQHLQFDLLLKRHSNKWLKFVNGTFTFTFADTSKFKIRQGNIAINQLRTQLIQDVVPGNLIPVRGYRTDFQIYDGRVSITVLGPQKYDDCDFVDEARPLLIGTFVISTTEPEVLPDYRIIWMKPYAWYQACSFKQRADSTTTDGLIWLYSDDNAPMEDSTGAAIIEDDSTSVTAAFINDTTDHKLILNDFRAEYIGQLYSKYDWNTKQEFKIVGYTVMRGLKMPGEENISFDQIEATWRPGDKYNPELVVPFNNPNPKVYGFYPDTVEFRGGDYCYTLHGSFLDELGVIYDMALDTACISIPRSVISFASASPEVFTSETTITYTVSDDVYLTAFVSDLLGKELKKLSVPEWGLLDRKEVKQGSYHFVFKAPDLASQGFYNIRFVAHPINDPSVEESRADVKLQLVK